MFRWKVKVHWTSVFTSLWSSDCIVSEIILRVSLWEIAIFKYETSIWVTLSNNNFQVWNKYMSYMFAWVTLTNIWITIFNVLYWAITIIHLSHLVWMLDLPLHFLFETCFIHSLCIDSLKFLLVLPWGFDTSNTLLNSNNASKFFLAPSLFNN